ncbi:MAG: SidA/IucD/PvdA family monooxygenase, partial [Micromonosporaceae bacterium]
MTTQVTTVADVHTIALGAGPGNLSLAALFEGAAPDRTVLFDAAPHPCWHPQLMLPGVRMQTSWLKDLVSVVDPTHRLSFLNYMVTDGRLFALLNAQFGVIPRIEYDRYLAWASEQLGNVHYGVRVDRVSFDGGFEIYSSETLVGRSQHLVVGLGSEPYVPEGFADVLGDSVFVPERLAERLRPMSADLDAPVAVVGCGQTGAECVLALLGAGFRNIAWFGRRPWFQPIDDSPPANEHYRPAYLEYLQQVSAETRRRLVDEATRTGDAITPGVLQSIYQSNYDRMLADGSFPLTILPDRSVIGAEACDGGYELRVNASRGAERHHARHIVLATGRRTR